MQADEIVVTVPEGPLGASLSAAADSHGLVIFAHGSGSSRFSPRNRFVAEQLQNAGFATLLMDLLTQDEDRRDQRTTEFRFDVALLGRRLLAATNWSLARFPALSIGYFGASTGAAAALIAAADLGERIAAVVSRGGRPDLAGAALARVTAPTLLLVGARDRQVIALNEEAQAQLRCTSELAIVPGASHLFEEPGTLEVVADLAARWFATNRSKSARLDSGSG
ncbi:MAG: dienelactone hydrolase family protein [Candidatus Eremiobacteraeota bacterium]|nr:dienelactone hydrolase family protein [Candidatus Eremiobacteraeota bacterium]MBV8356032.1 dienelactone hydrolase family protein [Candidatus Eremiobacteraeota bacterium]